jgi:signal transduction histidine kinase/DNA-binding NarL/FixJ family response regulator
MQQAEDKSFLAPVRGKVIAASLLACIAIGLALVVTYFSFYRLLDKVEELSIPNSKLKTLNNLFEQITKLDQEQRAEAIKNPKKSYQEFLKESKSLVTTIDSLHKMSWEDRKQEERLEAMKRILRKRDFLLIEYLKLKADFVFNKKFSVQLDSLADILTKTKPASDSSVKTTQKKITTTTYLPEEKKPSFFSRIFGGKKKESTESTNQNRVEVKEEVSIQVDTLAVAQQDSAILEVSRIMKSLEQDQRQQTKQMLKRELELISTNIVLINQLLSILQEVENEEISSIERKNKEAVIMVSSSTQRIGLIMVIFFLLAAVLVFLILVDISKSNYYRLQLIKARDQAEKLSKVKQRFLANMSHEIRTPLQSIIGFSDQLKNSQVDNEAVQAIQSSSEHLLHIVNEVLDYSRIESDIFTIEKTPFNLSVLFDEVTSAIRIQAEQKGLKFIVHSPHLESINLSGDAFRLRQILYNLLGNAVKFTSSGVVTFQIDIKQDIFVKCVFTISDTGIGIAPNDIGRIFGQFEQGDINIHKQYGGAGLGLSIVKKLVDLQKGRIEVKSEEAKGSVFTVTLNYERASAATFPVKQTNATKKLNPFTGKVILVDDDPLILKLCGLILEKHHIPFKTISQSEAVLKEDLSGVSFLFLDIRMPGINGVDLCKTLRAKTDARIIALTAHVLPQEQSSILENGFDKILTKPFREKDLMELLGVSHNGSGINGSSSMDLSALKKMTMGDTKFFQSILSQFSDETEKDLMELEAARSQMNDTLIREIVHKLAGRIGQMGSIDLSNQFHQIETKLNKSEKSDLLKNELDSAIQQLRLLLSTLQKEMPVHNP